MIEALSRFVEALRGGGVMISAAETIDAARALRAIGMDRRALVKAALRATLAKTHEDATRFDGAFDAFFLATPPASRRARRRRARGSSGEPPFGATRGRGVGSPRPRTGPSVQPPERPVGPKRARPGRLKVIRHRRHEGPEPIGAPAPEALPPGPRRQRTRPSAARPRRASTREGAGPAAGRRLSLRDPLTRDEEEAIAREVPALLREIRLKAGRRSRRARAGKPWAARLMRESVGTGGVPFSIPRRRGRPRRARVVALVDVSWSVLRASALFMMMAKELIGRSRRTRVHVFVDRCVDATAELAGWEADGIGSFARLVETLPDLDPRAASDYGRAFWQAAREPGEVIGGSRRDTVLVVLGDARTNFRDPQAWAFEELAQRCRRVIWLNPEPAALWNTGDSVLAEYLPACDVVCEARDLEGIARGVAEMARV